MSFCILSLRPKVIVTDVNLRGKKKGIEAEDHVQAGQTGQKLSQALPCGTVTTITESLHQFSEGRSRGLFIHPENVPFVY